MFENQSDLDYKRAILATALQYVDRGWAIFPVHSVFSNGLCTCGKQHPDKKDIGKHPVTRRGFKQASKDRQQIEEWFGGTELRNIGIATGQISGITVLDIDMGPGKVGEQSWRDINEDQVEPITLIARTGSGGLHLFFLYNSTLKTAGNVLGKHIDCRNDGGYVLATPSRHSSGNYYEWIDDKPMCHLPAHLARRKETRGRPRKGDFARGNYSLVDVVAMLAIVSPKDRDLWRYVGIILGREFNRSDEAWAAYVEWADRWEGIKGRNHDETMRDCFYNISQQTNETGRQLTMGTIVQEAIKSGWVPRQGDIAMDKFIYFAPDNAFIYRPTIGHWSASAVDSSVTPRNENGRIQKASDWLKQHKMASSITVDPGLDEGLIKGYDCCFGEIVPTGGTLFNAYRKPTVELGDARLAKPFLDHVRRVFNKGDRADKLNDAEQFLNYMAHRVQKPWEKIRYALILGGDQGIGKDTAVEMCVPAIGSHNVANISPRDLDSGFNEFSSAVLIRISEAANLHEMNRWTFNERVKTLISGTPDMCTINPKYGQKYTVRMCSGVIITTNHLIGGIYIPAGDRRYDVIETATLHELDAAINAMHDLAHDDLKRPARRYEYFMELWMWFLNDGGQNHVAAFLNERDITGFSAINAQRYTEAYKKITVHGMSDDEWLDDIIIDLGTPVVLRADAIMAKTVNGPLKEMEVRRRMAPALERLGYGLWRNPDRKDGRWALNGNGKRVTIYALFDRPQNCDLKAEIDNVLNLNIRNDIGRQQGM